MDDREVRADSDQDEEAQQRVTRLSQALSAWYTTRLTSDTTMSVLSSSAVGGLFVLTRDNVSKSHVSVLETGAYVAAMLCFAFSVWTTIRIFGFNSTYLTQFIKSENTAESNAKLKLLDRRLRRWFLAGMILASLGLLISVFHGVLAALHSGRLGL